jgi:hypothetical protein
MAARIDRQVKNDSSTRSIRRLPRNHLRRHFRIHGTKKQYEKLDKTLYTRPGFLACLHYFQLLVTHAGEQ